MYILGISAFYHDSAACLLQNETIIAAAQEERFSRIKNDARFPKQAILFCLKQAKIDLALVDYIVFYEKPFQKFGRLIETHVAFAPTGLFSFLKSMPLWIKEKLFQKKKIIEFLKEIDETWVVTDENLLFTQHHQSHAASAFFPSPFKQALILTLDGVGEWDTTTIALGQGNQVDFLQTIRFPHSIGLLYSAFTYFLGFKVNCDEYKVMGLAPYGKPVFKDLILEHLLDLKPDGSFRLNMDYFGYGNSLRMTTKKFDRLFGAKARKKNEELTIFHTNIACSIQAVTEEILLRIVTYLHKKYEFDNLCLAGGVALNCVANGRLRRESPFKNIWVQPAAGDAGGALGAAYAVYYNYLNECRSDTGADKMQNALLGSAYSNEEIQTVLIRNKLSFQKLENDALYTQTAQAIKDGLVVGWFRGRMEYGPRALGARSILADARNPKMQSTLNLKIKFRESFRPFAPAILSEFISDFYISDQTSPYMLFVDYLKLEKRIPQDENIFEASIQEQLNQIRSPVPAVTHVDYSSRIQTVSRHDNEPFYQLIHSFYDLTGCPMVLNTSFNRMDEPIVCSPEDAVSCFLNTGIDLLVIENFIIEKQILTN